MSTPSWEGHATLVRGEHARAARHRLRFVANGVTLLWEKNIKKTQKINFCWGRPLLHMPPAAVLTGCQTPAPLSVDFFTSRGDFWQNKKNTFGTISAFSRFFFTMRITLKKLNTSVVSSEQSESGLMGSVSGTVGALREGWEFLRRAKSFPPQWRSTVESSEQSKSGLMRSVIGTRRSTT